MTNIYELLGQYNLTVPEDKKTEFETALKANYRPVAEFDKVVKARDSFKSQLDTATQTLKSFEGVDVNELKTKVASLTTDLANSKADYEQKLADRDFNDLTASIAREFKVKDLKAVLPFIDVEKLKGSKNQSEDIKASFEQVKKDKAYLFEDEKAPKMVTYTSGPDKETNNANTKANDALRAFFGKD